MSLIPDFSSVPFEGSKSPEGSLEAWHSATAEQKPDYAEQSLWKTPEEIDVWPLFTAGCREGQDNSVDDEYKYFSEQLHVVAMFGAQKARHHP